MKTIIGTEGNVAGSGERRNEMDIEAMNFAQAALNLAHAYATMEHTRRENEAKK